MTAEGEARELAVELIELLKSKSTDCLLVESALSQARTAFRDRGRPGGGPHLDWDKPRRTESPDRPDAPPTANHVIVDNHVISTKPFDKARTNFARVAPGVEMILCGLRQSGLSHHEAQQALAIVGDMLRA